MRRESSLGPPRLRADGWHANDRVADRAQQAFREVAYDWRCGASGPLNWRGMQSGDAPVAYDGSGGASSWRSAIGNRTMSVSQGSNSSMRSQGAALAAAADKGSKMKDFFELTDHELLALGVPLEEEDDRSHTNVAEELKGFFRRKWVRVKRALGFDKNAMTPN